MSRYLNFLAVCGLLQAQSTFVRTDRGDAVIEIDASKKAGFKIPRTIYGTFLEPIGRSTYGGLWAQLIENPSFEENLWSAGNIRRMLEQNTALAASSQMGLPLPWEPLNAKQGSRYEPRWGDAANSSRSLLLMGLPEEEVGVRQEVFLPVHRVLRYNGSLWAKTVSGKCEARVSLRRRNTPDDTLASASLQLAGAGWKKYEFTLLLKSGRLARLEPADFVIAFTDESRALFDQVVLFPADALDGMDPEMIAMSRALNTPIIRFGGNFTSGYHWKDGVGPMDKRVSMLNQSWGMPEYNQFGTDEFLKFCRDVGAVPQICLNLGSGEPSEAAEWVRYVIQKWSGGKSGLPWELGNELWGNFQIGYPTLKRVAERTKAFSDAVRAADPWGAWIATGQDPDHFREWNAQQLGLPPGTFQFLSTHFVVGTSNVRTKNATPQFVQESAFALPVGLERHLREMKAQIDQTPAHAGKVKIAFTEWLFHGNTTAPRFDNMGGAICTAGFLNTLIRVADFVPVADMTGLIEFGGVWKKRSQVFGVPAYWAFRMYSTSDASVPVAVTTTVKHYDIKDGNNRIPDIPGVPYLDVVAALNDAGDKLTIFSVNRSLAGSMTASLRLAGFDAAAEARTLTLRADSLNAANDETNPEAVLPKEGRVTVSGNEIRHEFPPASVTRIELTRRSR